MLLFYKESLWSKLVLSSITLLFGYVLYNAFMDNSIIDFFPNKIHYFFYAISIPAFSLCIIWASKKLVLRESSHIYILLICVILPRIIWLLNFQPEPTSDSLLYHTFAYLLSTGNTLQDSSGYIALFPHIVVFPSLLAVLYKLIGVSIIIPLSLNVLFDCISSLLIYYIVAGIQNKNSALISAILFALLPSQIIYCGLIFTEKLFMVFTLASILVYIRSIQNPNPSSMVLVFCGFLISSANSVRPIGLLLLASFIISHYIIRKEFSKPKRYSQVLVLLISFIGFSLIFQFLIQASIGTRTAKAQYGYNFFVGMNKHFSGIWNKPDSLELDNLSSTLKLPAQEIHSKLFATGLQRFSEMTYKEKLNLFDDKINILWRDDFESIAYTKAGLMNNSQALFNLKYWEFFLIKTCNWFYFALLILFWGNTIRSFGHQKIYIGFYIFILLISLLHLFVEVAPRYHQPLIPLFCILAIPNITANHKFPKRHYH